MSASTNIEAAVIIEDDRGALLDPIFLDCPYWIALFKLCRYNERLMWKGSSLILSGGGYRTREEALKEFIASQYKDIPLLKRTHLRTTDNFNLLGIFLPYEEHPL